MKILFSIFLLSSVALLEVKSQAIPKKVVCYWRSGYLPYDKLNATLCTHIMYTFIGVNYAGSVIQSQSDAEILAMSNNWKNQNPNVKLMASINNDGDDTKILPFIANYSCLRNVFAQNVLQYLQNHNFDGLDLHWLTLTADDRNNLVSLLIALKSQLNPNGKLLSLAILPHINAYNIPQIVPQVDFINLIIWSYHGSWEGVTNYDKPLYSNPNDPYSIAAFVSYWLSAGIPNSMLVVGLLLHGNTWTLANVNNNGVGAASTGLGIAGSASNQPGILYYNEICQGVKSKKYTSKFDPARGATYAYGGNQWISYYDLQAVDAILSYIIAYNLGGALFWTMDQDDYNNNCGDGSYPLVTRAYTTLVIYCGYNCNCNKVGFQNIGTYQGVDSNNVAFRRSYYLPLHFQPKTWLQAAQICSVFNLNFATFKTQNEFDAVRGLLMRYLSLTNANNLIVHIGGLAYTPKSTFDWYWYDTNSQVSFPMQFASGQPDFSNNNEWALSLAQFDSMRFNDISFYEPQMFLCQQTV